MTGKIIISIITPSYNQVQFIERTIQSVLGQKTNFSIEFIIVDGLSNDGTQALLRKYDGQLKWVSEKDKGQSDAINKGIAMASGEIIGWLNSDDVYLPGALQLVADGFKSNENALWLYGMCRMIDENDHEIRQWISWYKKIRSNKFNFNRLLTENYISQPAVFFKKATFEKLGGLDLSLHYAMDYDLWLGLANLSSPIVIDEYVSAFRLHGTSKSTTNFRRLFSEQYAVRKKYNSHAFSLFIHRIKITLILIIYRLLAFLSK